MALPVIWGFGMVGLYVPMLPVFFRETGMNESQIALLSAIPALVSLAANQFWGYVADAWFNRKRVLMLLGVAASCVAFAFPFAAGFAVLAGLAALNGLFNDPRIPMVNAAILSNQGGEQAYGRIRLAGSLSFVVVAFIGARIAREWGISAVFPAIIVVNLLMILSLIPLRDHPPRMGRKSQGEGHRGFWEAQRTLCSKTAVRWFLLFLVLYQLPHAGSYLMQILHVQAMGGDTQSVALVVSISALAEVAVFWYGRSILARVRLMWLFLIAIVAQVLRWSLVWAAPSLGVIYATCVLHALTYGLHYLCAVLMMNRETPPELRSSSQTLLAIVYSSFGAVLGPTLSAGVLRYVDLRDWFLFGAGLSLLSLIPWFPMKRAYEHEHQVSGFWIR